MRYQAQPGECGVAVIVNALTAHGIRVSYRSVRKFTGCGPGGIDEATIIGALRYYGLKAESYSCDRRNEAWLWLHGALLQGRCVVLCVDKSQHWVLAFGTLHDRVNVYDSTRTRANKAVNGVHVLSNGWLMARWLARKGPRYFGISAAK